jgi:hypothetical protein
MRKIRIRYFSLVFILLILLGCVPKNATLPYETQTPSITPSPTFQGQEVINLVTQYFACVNKGNVSTDFINCWDLLPPEFKASQKDGFEGYVSYWTQYKVGGEIFYCDNNLVIAKLQNYNFNELSTPINPNYFDILIFTLALDVSGWWIKSVNKDTYISSTCNPISTISPLP